MTNDRDRRRALRRAWRSRDHCKDPLVVFGPGGDYRNERMAEDFAAPILAGEFLGGAVVLIALLVLAIAHLAFPATSTDGRTDAADRLEPSRATLAAPDDTAVVGPASIVIHGQFPATHAMHNRRDCLSSQCNDGEAVVYDSSQSRSAPDARSLPPVRVPTELARPPPG